MSEQVACVLLDDAVVPDTESVVEALHMRYPGIAVEASPQPSEPGQHFIPFVRCDGDDILVMPAAYRLSEADYRAFPSRRAKRLWPEAKEVLMRHRAYLVLKTAGESGDRLHSARSLTAVVGSIIATTPGCCAVAWEGMVIHPARRWLDLSRRAFALSPRFPYLLWVSLHPFEDAGGVVVITFGLRAFVDCEIELDIGKASAATVIETAAALTVYLLEHGAVIGDGHTVGTEGGFPMTVRSRFSRRVKGLPVLHVTPLTE